MIDWITKFQAILTLGLALLILIATAAMVFMGLLEAGSFLATWSTLLGTALGWWTGRKNPAETTNGGL